MTSILLLGLRWQKLFAAILSAKRCSDNFILCRRFAFTFISLLFAISIYFSLSFCLCSLYQRVFSRFRDNWLPLTFILSLLYTFLLRSSFNLPRESNILFFFILSFSFYLFIFFCLFFFYGLFTKLLTVLVFYLSCFSSSTRIFRLLGKHLMHIHTKAFTFFFFFVS